jgi:hypothetical protein
MWLLLSRASIAHQVAECSSTEQTRPKARALGSILVGVGRAVGRRCTKTRSKASETCSECGAVSSSEAFEQSIHHKGNTNPSQHFAKPNAVRLWIEKAVRIELIGSAVFVRSSLVAGGSSKFVQGVRQPAGTGKYVRVIRIRVTLTRDVDCSEAETRGHVAFTFPLHISTITAHILAQH